MPTLAQVYAKSAQRGRQAEPLTAHLAAALRGAVELRRRVGRIALTEPVLDGTFWPIVQLAALAHDAGKVATGFQHMVTGGARRWDERHEVLSLGFLPALVPDPGMRTWVASAVVTHHRPLTEGDKKPDIAQLYALASPDEFDRRMRPVDPQLVRELAGWLSGTAATQGLPVGAVHDDGPADLVGAARQMLHEVLNRWEDPASGDRGLVAVLLQGAVTLADHLSSAHGTLHSRQPLDATFPGLLSRWFADQGNPLRPHQVDCGRVSGHLLLRAPTGSGKTEAGLLWAARQVATIAEATGATPRVFITLPYLASINAMADRLDNLLDTLLGERHLVGVAHSRAASYHLSAALAEDTTAGAGSTRPDQSRTPAASKAVSRAAATRLFRETVRVATPYQLLRAALAGPAHAGILIDTANSVFVLDELHAYDPVRLGYILATAGLWERLGGRVAVLSATLPRALADLLTQSLSDMLTTVDATAGAAEHRTPTRHRLSLRQRHLTDPASITEIAAEVAGERAVLVVANNIADAQRLYDVLAPIAHEHHGAHAATLLHSRFTRRDRGDIETHITGRYGTGSGRAPGLVVATQVVEVSLDVDFDILFTSGAPLEALLQRFGRVNRLGERDPADVVVHEPAYRARRDRPAEEQYADGIYLREPVHAGWRILTRHHGQPVDEVQATGWLDEVYDGDWGKAWRERVSDARKKFEAGFLTFGYPFAGREQLSDAFDELFDGTEAILAADLDRYAEALQSADGAAGRLLGEQYLIPIPYWTTRQAAYDKALRVRVIDGVYDGRRGLLGVRAPSGTSTYHLGEVL